MATNPPKNYARRGMVRGRSQTYNPKIDKYVKRDTKTGKFLNVKQDGKKFKGVRTEKQSLTVSLLFSKLAFFKSNWFCL